MNNFPIMLTTKEASAVLKMATKTFLQYAREGLIPKYKIGKTYLFKESDVFELIEKSKVKPGIKMDNEG